MNEQAKKPPADDKGNPLAAFIIFFLMFSLGAAAALGGAAERYELYADGVVAKGKVIEAYATYESRSNSKGPSTSVKTIAHEVSYDGFKSVLKQKTEIPAGSDVYIYYSRSNPQNAMFKPDGKPWGSVFMILADPIVIGVLLLSSLFLIPAIYSLRLLRAQRAEKRIKGSA